VPWHFDCSGSTVGQMDHRGGEADGPISLRQMWPRLGNSGDLLRAAPEADLLGNGAGAEHTGSAAHLPKGARRGVGLAGRPHIRIPRLRLGARSSPDGLPHRARLLHPVLYPHLLSPACGCPRRAGRARRPGCGTGPSGHHRAVDRLPPSRRSATSATRVNSLWKNIYGPGNQRASRQFRSRSPSSPGWSTITGQYRASGSAHRHPGCTR
jgi:hypothetical protein